VAILDPLAALVIAAIALKEGVGLWRGRGCACHTFPGLADTRPTESCDEACCSCLGGATASSLGALLT
jgi:hypothetical protein